MKTGILNIPWGAKEEWPNQSETGKLVMDVITAINNKKPTGQKGQ